MYNMLTFNKVDIRYSTDLLTRSLKLSNRKFEIITSKGGSRHTPMKSTMLGCRMDARMSTCGVYKGVGPVGTCITAL